MKDMLQHGPLLLQLHQVASYGYSHSSLSLALREISSA
jgi:hypothetical protein